MPILWGIAITIVILGGGICFFMERARRGKGPSYIEFDHPNPETLHWLNQNAQELERLMLKNGITGIERRAKSEGYETYSMLMSKEGVEIVKILVNLLDPKNTLVVMGLYEEGTVLYEKVSFSVDPYDVAVMNRKIIQRLQSDKPLPKPIPHPQLHPILDDIPN